MCLLDVEDIRWHQRLTTTNGQGEHMCFDHMTKTCIDVKQLSRGIGLRRKPLSDRMIRTLSDSNDCPKGRVGVNTHTCLPYAYGAH